MWKEILSGFGDLFKELIEKEEFWFLVFVAGIAGILFIPIIGLGNLVKIIFNTILLLWWFWIFLILFFLFRDLLLFWRREVFKSKRKFVLLEIKVPPQIEKSAEAMELVLNIISNYQRAPFTIKDKYFDGVVNNVFSLEIVFYKGEIRFFIRVPIDLRKVIEGAFFAYYPDIELEETNVDYADEIPGSDKEVKMRGYNIWGAELLLEKEAMYPIKTYKYFENLDETKRFDPITGFLEIMSKLKKDEILGIQILIEPSNSKWKDEFSKALEDLKKQQKQQKNEGGNVAFINQVRSPGEIEVIKAVETNLSKPAFSTLIRFLFVSPEQNRDRSVVQGGLSAVFNQFKALNLNSFRMNFRAATSINVWIRPGISLIYAKKRLSARISRMLINYKNRLMPVTDTFWGKIIYSSPFAKVTDSEKFYFTSECLATIFHPPTYLVPTSLYIKKMPTRKVNPPLGLAIFGEEEDIQKFK